MLWKRAHSRVSREFLIHEEMNALFIHYRIRPQKYSYIRVREVVDVHGILGQCEDLKHLERFTL